MSLPSRERGLKYTYLWMVMRMLESLPSRERGLKLLCLNILRGRILVAPLAEAWIEMQINTSNMNDLLSRSPRGSVD